MLQRKASLLGQPEPQTQQELSISSIPSTPKESLKLRA
ncbi:hypothetical protein H1P_150008 [Hyella patelloides LEGE 07179]|uniref:Uncharacterized protein n=1 Tax=Hyella patelloides LEGE 07179 TaxID=945734 RepID=A0A563VLW5_9CYAN|nr:hypothetical protein H1P_150008 [Hyella patelloides LEGE 07179]